jgi:hypothetical protein
MFSHRNTEQYMYRILHDTIVVQLLCGECGRLHRSVCSHHKVAQIEASGLSARFLAWSMLGEDEDNSFKSFRVP